VTLTNLNDGELKEVKKLQEVVSEAYSLGKNSIKFKSLVEKSLNMVDEREKTNAYEFYKKLGENIQDIIYLPPFESRAMELEFTGCI
jgi:hypothetical protein